MKLQRKEGERREQCGIDHVSRALHVVIRYVVLGFWCIGKVWCIDIQFTCCIVLYRDWCILCILLYLLMHRSTRLRDGVQASNVLKLIYVLRVLMMCWEYQWCDAKHQPRCIAGALTVLLLLLLLSLLLLGRNNTSMRRRRRTAAAPSYTPTTHWSTPLYLCTQRLATM